MWRCDDCGLLFETPWVMSDGFCDGFFCPSCGSCLIEEMK